MATQTSEQIKMAQTAAKKFGVKLPDKISSSDLTGTPVPPTITPPKTGTSAAGVLGAVESSQDQFTKLLEQQRKDAEASKKASQSDYTARLFEGPTLTEVKADQYVSQGVDTAQRELDDITSQIQVEQHSLRREVERIQDNAVGASMGQVANMVSEVENKSLRKQADLAVIQMGLQGKFNTAKAIADRAVDAAMEKEKNIIEALRINYEDNKEMFTKAEQRQFDSLLNDRNNKYQEEVANKKAISDYSIEAMRMGADGATIQAIRSAATPAEAQALAAQYTSPLIQQQNALDVQAKQTQIASAQHSMQMDNERLALEYAKLGRDQAEKEMEALVAQEKADKATQVQFTKANRIIDQIDSVLPKINYQTAGFAGVFGFVPGSKQKNLKAEIASIRANIGFNELQEMRNSSPTGGALGQVAVQELEFLQSTLGNLDTTQSPTQLKENLMQVKSHFQNWKALVEADKTGKITVVSKDGVSGVINADELDEALNEGYTLP